MAKEILAIPESHLADVVAIIENGLRCDPLVDSVAWENLKKWCIEQRQYLVQLSMEQNEMIKECPFCGHYQWQAVEYQPGCFKLICKACGASGPTSNNRKNCIKGWNVRVKDRVV